MRLPVPLELCLPNCVVQCEAPGKGSHPQLVLLKQNNLHVYHNCKLFEAGTVYCSERLSEVLLLVGLWELCTRLIIIWFLTLSG